MHAVSSPSPVFERGTLARLLLMILLISGTNALASRSSAAPPDPAREDVQKSRPADKATPAESAESAIDALLEATDADTGWRVSCEESGPCVFEREVPARGGRPGDTFLLKVELDNPRQPDLILLIAPRRVHETRGITIAFLDDPGDLDPNTLVTTSITTACMMMGCGTALRMTMELEDGTTVGSQLASAGMLWLYYVLDGEPLRALVSLESLREAIAKHRPGRKSLEGD